MQVPPLIQIPTGAKEVGAPAWFISIGISEGAQGPSMMGMNRGDFHPSSSRGDFFEGGGGADVTLSLHALSGLADNSLKT